MLNYSINYVYHSFPSNHKLTDSDKNSRWSTKTENNLMPPDSLFL